MGTVTTLIKSLEVVNQGIVKGTPMSSRFDASQVDPNIAEAELRFLKTFINPEFFDDLIAEMNPLPSNYNIDIGPIVLKFPTQADYEELWTQWLFSFLSKAAMHESYDNIIIQVGSNGAFFNNQGPFGENIGIKGLTHLKDSALESLKGTQPFIIEFLCANEDKYPLFDREGHCGDCDKNSKNNIGRNAGFVLRPKKHKKHHG